MHHPKEEHDDGQTIFVTVGTTKFEALIDQVLSNTKLLKEKYNASRIIIQYGNGKKPIIEKNNDVKIEVFDFKPTLVVCCYYLFN